MARFFSLLVLLGLSGVTLVGASPKGFDQEEQNRNADCDNDCFFGSFPGGSCTDDAACMCTQQKYRERYFCCMAEKCAASVLPDSVQRQTLECEARNMEFTFDVEKVCGIKLTTTSSAVSSTATSTTTSGSNELSGLPTLASTALTPKITTAASSPSASEESSTESAAPTTNSGRHAMPMLEGAAAMVILTVMMLY